MVAPRSAPHSRRAAMIVRAKPLAAVLGCHLDAPEADPVVAVRCESLRRPRHRGRGDVVLHGDDDAGGVDAAERSPGGRHRRELELGVGVVALRYPSEAREEGPLVRLGQHRRDSRLPERSRSAPPPRSPSQRHTNRGLEPPIRMTLSGRRGRSWRGGRWRWPTSAAASPRGRRPGATTRSGNSANARTWASRGVTRNRGEGRGGTGLPETMSAMRIVTGGPPEEGATTQTPSAQAVHTPRTSVIAGPPDGPV